MTAEFCVGVTLRHVNVIETVDIVNDHGHFYEVSPTSGSKGDEHWADMILDYGVCTVRPVLRRHVGQDVATGNLLRLPPNH